jgi:hypothetical protein
MVHHPHAATKLQRMAALPIHESHSPASLSHARAPLKFFASKVLLILCPPSSSFHDGHSICMCCSDMQLGVIFTTLVMMRPTEEADWSWHGLIITNSMCKGAEFAVNEIDREWQHVGSHLCCHGSL